MLFFQVEGTIPAELSGTLLRNGPGLFEIGDKKVGQPFDGDGLVCTFAFKEGKAFFRNKYVRTEGFVREQREQKPLYRSAFNKGLPDGQWCVEQCFIFTIVRQLCHALWSLTSCHFAC